MPNSSKPISNCQSCLIPFSKDPGKREHELYCSLCYRNGDFCYKGDLKGFQKAAYESMISRGMNKFKAKFFAFMTRFAPRWKNV
ncbi:MAG TPA: zinc ribbon domain-containing protein [Patescibacteria group bacterium]|nr:zinc ribbon domain-containing protein [Patescibacteria group bacterium]